MLVRVREQDKSLIAPFLSLKAIETSLCVNRYENAADIFDCSVRYHLISQISN